jgi:hypothetical protein
VFFQNRESSANKHAHSTPRPITVNTVPIGAIVRSTVGRILGSAHAMSHVIASISCDGYVVYIHFSTRHRAMSHITTHRPSATKGNTVLISQLVNQLINSSTGSYIHTINKIYDPDIHGRIIALLHSIHHMKYHHNVVGNVNCKTLVMSIQTNHHAMKYQRPLNDQYLKKNRTIEAMMSHENSENTSIGCVSSIISSHDAQTMIAVSIHSINVIKKFH